MPSPGSSKPTPFRSPSSAKPTPFRCTLCWNTYHPDYQPYEKPKLLGDRARIVCEQCYKAVLDLSICWVCGEVIVRGDEVVSLGWCFWHEACFGCLVCGTGMRVPACDDVETEDYECYKTTERGRGRQRAGVQLHEIPLCSVCEIETDDEEREEVLRRGLETVSSFDGGLARERLDMMSADTRRTAELALAPKDISRPYKRPRNDTLYSTKRRCKTLRSRGETLSLENQLKKQDAPYLRQTDGPFDERPRTPNKISEHVRVWWSDISTQSEFSWPEDQNTNAYLSIFDPLGEAAFRPSRGKPLPRWMNLLPNNVYQERKLAKNREKSNSILGSERVLHGKVSESSGYEPLETAPRPLKPKRQESKLAEKQDTRYPSPSLEEQQESDDYFPHPHHESELHKASSDCLGDEMLADMGTPAITLSDKDSKQFPHLPTTAPRITKAEAVGAISDVEVSRPAAARPPPLVSFSKFGTALGSAGGIKSSEFLERYKPKTSPGAIFDKYKASAAIPVLQKFEKGSLEMMSRGMGATIGRKEGRNIGQVFESIGESGHRLVEGGSSKGVDREMNSAEAVDRGQGGGAHEITPSKEDLTKELKGLFAGAMGGKGN